MGRPGHSLLLLLGWSPGLSGSSESQARQTPSLEAGGHWAGVELRTPPSQAQVVETCSCSPAPSPWQQLLRRPGRAGRRPQTAPVAQVLAVERAGRTDLPLLWGALSPSSGFPGSVRSASYPPRHAGFPRGPGGGLDCRGSHQRPVRLTRGPRTGLAVGWGPCLALGSSCGASGERGPPSSPGPAHLRPRPRPQAAPPGLAPPTAGGGGDGGNFSDLGR